MPDLEVMQLRRQCLDLKAERDEAQAALKALHLEIAHTQGQLDILVHSAVAAARALKQLGIVKNEV